ncbi:trihelix transcription factor PTL-like [Durio zibethinus]|uniref:Trihelix transcription factor PTL-like n=1 Tax=Durio zibethinus TaxID=66656 RepID=A0A6P5XTN2_DURZI|nr:trihelix transcription factor PTL-like [Durio zibethinus]
MHPVKYGAHHLQQQLLMDDDGSSSSVFSISNPYHQQQQSVLHPNYPLHFQQQQKQHQTLFQQHSLPVTHQLFQHHHQHQFQPFQEQAETVHHHHVHQQPFLAVNFKLGLNENSRKKEVALALNHQTNDATFLHGNEQHVPENRRPQQHSLLTPHCWHPQEDSPIKEPFWKPLNRCEDRQCSGDEAREIEWNKYNKVLQQPDQCTSERSKNLENRYRLFGELEAIYGLAKGGETTRAGSGSALTGENSPANVGLSMLLTEFQGHNVGANVGFGNVATGVDHGSEASIGEEASLRKIQKKKRKKKMKEQLSSMVGFFESLVKQVMDHQEGLHRRFLEVIERMDKERSVKEESWSRQEAEKRNREAIARAHEQALASSREAFIVSYLEKITGQSINLPARAPLLMQRESAIEPYNESTPVKVDNNSRWPRAEVEALIQVRCNLESKFREPGLKGPLWEEVSSFMASLGYQRSAKRCKEKWENINKYFRKSKENVKKRSQQSKTCPYFDQLDQLYSRIPITCPTSPTPLINSYIEMQQQDDSNFLEAYMPKRDLGTAQVNGSGNLKVSEMNFPKLDFDGAVCENIVQGSNRKDNESHGNYLNNEGERVDDDNESDGEE